MKKYTNTFFACLILGVIDRIENDYAAIEMNKYNNITINLPISLLPDLISEGDSLCLISDNNQNLQLLPKKKLIRKRE